MKFTQFKKQNPIGTKIKGTVIHIEPFGAFVRLTESIDGLIKVPDLCFEEASNFPEDYPKVGDILEVWILWYGEGEKVSLTQKPENHQRLKNERTNGST